LESNLINVICILSFRYKIWNNFGGKSLNIWKIFTLRKKIIRIMAGAQPRTLCRNLCKQFEILPVPWQYIRSLLNCVISNHGIFQTNLCVYNINTRNKHYLHRPNADLSCFQISTFLADIKSSTFYHLVWQSSKRMRQNLKQCWEDTKYALLLLCRWIFNV
jgi:hypothetical protein